MLFILALTEHCADGVVTCIAHDLEWKTPIRRLYDGCGHQCLYEGIEGYKAVFVLVEWGLLGQETCQRPGNMGEILDESPIETSMT